MQTLDAVLLHSHARVEQAVRDGRKWNCHMSFLKNLGDAQVLTPQGETLSLSSTWQDQDTVLVFIRHFG